MSKQTGIGWCDSTSNVVIGCTKKSPGCESCYALIDTPARVLRHRGIETWGPKGTRVPVKSFEANMLAMNRKPWICDLCGTASASNRRDSGSCLNSECPYHQGLVGSFHRRRVFADSNSDWLDKQWALNSFVLLLEVIRRCTDLDILLLTKRPEDFPKRMAEACEGICAKDNVAWQWLNGNPPANCWIGTSVENQKYADERIPLLLQIPARVRFLSVEPLLEKTDLKSACFNGADSFGTMPGIHWGIVGAESGNKRRDCGVDAIVDVANQFRDAKVSCYVKQDCHRLPGQQGRIPDDVWALKQFPTPDRSHSAPPPPSPPTHCSTGGSPVPTGSCNSR